MRSLLVITLALLLFGCPSGAASPGPGPVAPANSGPTMAEDVAQLTIPPTAETAAALARLNTRADNGEISAGWERAHYLLDTFDDSRFRGNVASLGVLAAAVGSTDDEMRAPGGTDKAISALLVEMDRVLAANRLHGGAQAARTVIEFDQKPPTARDQVFQRMVELKTVARGGGPIASNALMRLYGYCWRAINDAARAPRAHRMRILVHCLYPLYDSDPENYFSDSADVRPPPPNWSALVATLRRMIDPSAWSSRLVLAARTQREAVDAFVKRRGAALPRLPDPAAMRLPSVARAVPYDWTPMLELGDGKKLAEQSVLAESLRQQIQGDGRSNVAVALAAHAPASALTHAAKASAAAGATIIELLVTTPQTLSVPAGDYWAGRLDSNQVTRLAAIPISLALLGATAAGPGGKPRATNWDPSRAALRLYLVVDQKKWTLTSPTGRVATIVSATDRNDAVKALRKTLAEVRLAFPDEDALVVVPGRNLTLGALASAIDAAARDAKGRRLFSRIALAESAPKVVKNSLGRRIQRRWRATVTVNPQSLAPRIAVARGCYQSLLEKNGKLAARLRLEVSNGVAKVTDGPKNKKLRACATTALGATMAAGGIISATITFGPK